MGRQLFVYQGQEYDLPDTYTPEQAKARIIQHLGQQPKPQAVQPPEVPKRETSILQEAKRGLTEDVPYGVQTALDFLAGGLASTFGAEEDAAKIFRGMETRTKAREALQAKRAQEEQAPSFGAKVARGITGGLPQLVTAPATETAEVLQRGATPRQAAGVLGTSLGETALGAVLPAGKGLLKGLGIGAGTTLLTSPVTDIAKKKILAGTEAAKPYEKSIEDYLVEAAAGGVTGGVLGKLGTTGKQPAVKKGEPTPDLAKREAAFNAKSATQQAAQNKAKADTTAPAPSKAPYETIGTQYELQMPGAKTTKAGAKARKELEKVRGPLVEEEAPTPGLTEQERAAQLDMFDEANRQTVERVTLEEQLRQSQELEALRSGAMLRREQRAQYPESFDAKAVPKGIEQTAQDVIKQEQIDAAWNDYKRSQIGEYEASWQNAIREEGRALNREKELTAIQERLMQEPSTDYGMGRKTREFIQQEALQRMKGKQAGAIDPYVFVDGFKKAIDLIKSGVTNFSKFSKELITTFGDKIKPYIQQMFTKSKEFESKQKQQRLTMLQKHGMPIHQLALDLKDPRFTNALDQIDRVAADVRNLFRAEHYQEEYTGNPFSSGAKLGRKGFAGFLKNPETLSMLEKYKPFWNSEKPVNTKDLNFTPKELEAFLDLRDTLDSVAKSLGIDIVTNPNYMPRLRMGDHLVIARDKNGQLHIEASDSIAGVGPLRKQLEKEGYEIVDSGLKADLMQQPEYRSVLSSDYIPKGILGDPASTHMKEAANIPGYSGQRNTKDMMKSLSTYMERVSNSLVRDEYQKLMTDFEKTLPADQLEVLQKYMEASIGLGFLNESKMINDLARDLQRKLPPIGKAPEAIRMAAQAFNSYKVMPSVTNLIQATMSPIFGLQQLMRMQGDQGLNVTRASGRMLESAVKSLLGKDTPQNKAVADRAVRSGYLQNIADIVGLMSDVNRTKASAIAKESLKDLSRAGRLELKARKDFLVGLYNHYLYDVGLTQEEAFHRAGQATRQAFVGTRPEDRAPWVRTLGPVAPLVSSLTTFPIGMAAMLKANIGRNMSRGQWQALGTILAGSVIAGGLRGAPTSELMEGLTYLYNIFADEEDQLASFDALLLDYGKKNEMWGMAMNGIPSQVMGVDMARSLGWPGITQLVPFYEDLKAVATGKPGDIAPPIKALSGIAQGAGTLGGHYLGETAAGPGELEQAWQQGLPRFAQKSMDQPEIYNKRGEVLGVTSPEATQAAQLTGSRSLEEAQIRAQEQTLEARSKSISGANKQVDDKLVKSLLYGNDKQVDSALDGWIDTYSRTIPKGAKPNVEGMVSDLIDRVIGSTTNPEEREILDQRLTNILLRQEYENKE